MRTWNRWVVAAGMLAVSLGAWAQAPKGAAAVPVPAMPAEQPDANRTKEELNRLLEKYPPTLRNVLALDHALLGNPTFLTPYPALVAFLNAHPEIARNPSFYVGERNEYRPDPSNRAFDLWRDVFAALAVFTGLTMAIGVIAWLIRTLIDYRRWSRLSKVQAEVHTKLLDRFTANDDLLAYIQSPAGAKFLESSPIKLDPGPRSVGAPLGRILWSLQGGLVLMAAGIGMQIVSGRVRDEAGQPLQALGVLAVALGIGFLISAIISYVISRRLGLIDAALTSSRPEPPSAQA